MSVAQAGPAEAVGDVTLPRSTRRVGAWIKREFGLVYESRSGSDCAAAPSGARTPQARGIRKLDPSQAGGFHRGPTESY